MPYMSYIHTSALKDCESLVYSLVGIAACILSLKLATHLLAYRGSTDNSGAPGSTGGARDPKHTKSFIAYEVRCWGITVDRGDGTNFDTECTTDSYFDVTSSLLPENSGGHGCTEKSDTFTTERVDHTEILVPGCVERTCPHGSSPGAVL